MRTAIEESIQSLALVSISTCKGTYTCTHMCLTLVYTTHKHTERKKGNKRS